MSTEFANEFSTLVSCTVAMMPAAAVLALDRGDFCQCCGCSSHVLLDRWRDCSVAGVAQITGAIWQVTLRMYATSNAIMVGPTFWIFSRQDPQNGASHRRAVVCEQLAQGCYLRVQWLGIEPTTSRSLGPKR